MLKHVGIIGYGRMGGLIAQRLLNDGKSVSCLLPTHPVLMESQRCDDVVTHPMGITFYRKPEPFFSENETIILAIRPAHLEHLVVCAGSYVRSYHSIVSIMASTTTSTLKEAFPRAHITRIMPNIYINNRVSYIPYFHESNRNMNLTTKLFNGNRLIRLDEEEHLDGFTKINSCSPALFSWMFQELSNVIEKYTLTSTDCTRCVNVNIECDGSCEHQRYVTNKHMREETRRALLNALYLTAQDLENRHPQAIIDEVASPGGVTRASIDKLPSLE